jgi:hypothetical protein
VKIVCALRIDVSLMYFTPQAMSCFVLTQGKRSVDGREKLPTIKAA